VKRALIKLYLLLFGRCYCAAIEREPGAARDDLDDLADVSYPTRSHRAADAKARRREAKSGQHWVVTRWVRT